MSYLKTGLKNDSSSNGKYWMRNEEFWRKSTFQQQKEHRIELRRLYKEIWEVGGGVGWQDNSHMVSVKEETVCATTAHRHAILLTFWTVGKYFHAIWRPTVSALYQCQEVVLKYVTSRVLWQRSKISDQLFLFPSRCPKKNTRFRRSSPATVLCVGEGVAGSHVCTSSRGRSAARINISLLPS
jgi:hypothetical protein